MSVLSVASGCARCPFDRCDDRQFDEHRVVTTRHTVAKPSSGGRGSCAAKKTVEGGRWFLGRLYCRCGGRLNLGSMGLVSPGRPGGAGSYLEMNLYKLS